MRKTNRFKSILEAHIELFAFGTFASAIAFCVVLSAASSSDPQLCEPGQLLWTSSRKPPMEIVVDGKLIHIISWSSHDGYMCLDTYQE